MKKQILIVDDDDDILQTLRMVLQLADYQVETAQDGQEALDRLEHYQPDLIIADYNMPNMPGDVLFQRVKQHQKHKTIPFIFLTAINDGPTKVRSLQNGATDYIVKPFSKDELLARVATHIAYRDTLTDTFKEEVDQIRANLLNNVSHELKTPLAVIMGYVGMLLEDMEKAPEMRQRFLQSTYQASLRLRRVIENLLFISKAQSGQLEYHPQALPVEFLLGKLVEHYRRKVEDELVLDLPARALPLLWADHNKVNAALEQLIDNALKFKEYGKKAAITISARAADGEIQISVQDKGIGLSPEHKAHIFEPLYQGDASSTRSYGGTGAGLQIVKIVVDMHNGRIEVESQEGEGSVFTLILPQASTPSD